VRKLADRLRTGNRVQHCSVERFRIDGTQLA
jgi:hypothetical protein